MKKKNEIVYWVLFIIILMCISIYIILYFRGNRALQVYDDYVVENDNTETIVVE